MDDINKELDEFEIQIQKYLNNEIGDVKFQKIRLQLGTYAQRQEGYQMQRIKIPCGDLTPVKLTQLANVSDDYASGFIHLTTRQDVQLYSIKIKNSPNMLRDLAQVGITTRESCGNTVRNITSAHRSGTNPLDAFDVTGYAMILAEHLMYCKYNQVMGRKFKICFESSNQDTSGLLIHDLGFQARIIDENDQKKRGFRVYMAGGLGGMPFLGKLYTDFLPEEDLLSFVKVTLRVFDRIGERKSRMRARMKFLVEKIGFDVFKQKIDEERKIYGKDSQTDQYLSQVCEYEKLNQVEKVTLDEAPKKESSDDLDYTMWKTDNVLAHKIQGFSSLLIRVPLGDITSGTARKFSKLVEKYSSQGFRVTLDQNLYVLSVHDDYLYDFYQNLKDLDLSEPGAETILDTVACPGADSCRLGITSAKGVATAISNAVNNELSEYKELIKSVRIKISGCPNSCAHHHMGQIGFHGSSFNKDNHAIPTLNVYVGGIMDQDQTHIGEFVSKIPSKNVIQVIGILFEYYQKNRLDNVSFDQFMRETGKEKIQNLLDPYSLRHIPSFEEDPSFYKDWDSEEEFGIQRGVKGECAGATIEEKIPNMENAQKKLTQANALFSHKEYGSAISEYYHSMGSAAAVCNYQKLVDPFTTEQNIWEFENLFVRTGQISSDWLDISDRAEALIQEDSTQEIAEEIKKLATSFTEECQAALTSVV